MNRHVRAGEVWKISHSRKGAFTAKFLTDANLDTDAVSVEIVEGQARFMSGNEGAGAIITIRGSMTTLVERVGAAADQ